MIDKADALGKVKSLDPTSYQRLALAAEKADATIEDVEKGTITLNKSLAATKLPDALAASLDKAGLSAETLRAAKPEQQIHMIADAISKLEDPGEQASLALNLMGESGLKLVPMLREGGAAIKGIGDTAQKQGRIISAEAISAAGALNDSLDAIKEPLAGIATQVVTGIIPRIAGGLDSLVAFIEENKTEIMAVIDAVTNGIARAVDIAGRVLTTLAPVLEAVWEQGMRVVDAFMAMFGGVEGGQETLDNLLATLAEYLIPAVESLGDILVWLMEHVLSPAITIFTDLWTLLGNLATSLGLVGEGGGMVGDVLSGIASIITGTLGRAIDTLVGGLRTIIGLFNSFTTGTWEDAFMALGNALLDFILQPLRSIVSTVVTIADAC
jgi:phage-related protein